MAAQTLQTLRDLYFISSRFGASSFSQYTFVYFTAIDILSQYPAQAEAFLEDIRPAEIGLIPQHPLDRCHDLFFLNVAEHFPLVVTPQVNEQLLLRASMPYLGVGGDQRLLETFEAAHSVVLAVFLAPQNFDLVISHVRPYIDALFQVSTIYIIHLLGKILTNMNAGVSAQSLLPTISYGRQDPHPRHVAPVDYI